MDSLKKSFVRECLKNYERWLDKLEIRLTKPISRAAAWLHKISYFPVLLLKINYTSAALTFKSVNFRDQDISSSGQMFESTKIFCYLDKQYRFVFIANLLHSEQALKWVACHFCSSFPYIWTENMEEKSLTGQKLNFFGNSN